MLRCINKNEGARPTLVDQFGRTISYLRVSVTDRCNFNCFYCRPPGRFTTMRHIDILSYEEIYRLIRIAVGLGIGKVRLTGGEPLVRNGLVDFIPRLASIPGLDDISLTTNGAGLKENLQRIHDGGIRRLNISMDTVQRDRFRNITGADRFDEVWEAIDMAAEMNFSPIKINMVVINGVNDDEVVDMAMISTTRPLHIRFIEYMPIGVENGTAQNRTVPASQIKQRLERFGKLVPVEKGKNDGPALRFRFQGAPGEIGFISSMTNHFCESCNRLRLTADGQLRSCLLNNIQEDIKGPLRSGAMDHELAAIFVKSVKNKPSQHLLTDSRVCGGLGRMHMIGG